MKNQQSVDVTYDFNFVRDRIRNRLANTVADIIAIGQDLLLVKEQLPHGSFGPWVKDELGITNRTAQRFVHAAQMIDGKSDMVSHLAPTTIYALSAPSTPDAVREDFLNRAQSGELITETMVKESRKEHAHPKNSSMQAETVADTDTAPVVKTDPENALDGEAMIQAGCDALIVERGRSAAIEIMRNALAKLEASAAPEDHEDKSRQIPDGPETAAVPKSTQDEFRNSSTKPLTAPAAEKTKNEDENNWEGDDPLAIPAQLDRRPACAVKGAGS